MDSDSDMELMKRGGRKRRPRATQVQKVKQSQVVNVTVHTARPRAKKAASDMVMLRPDREKPRGLFKAGYTPAEPLRAAGPGFFFANAPAPSQASAYGNAPAAVRPLSDHVFRSSSDPSKNFNQNKGDDRVEAVNPSGIVSGVNEVRALPSAFVHAQEVIAQSGAVQEALKRSIRDMAPFVGRPVGPPENRVEEVRALPSAGVEAMRQAFARMPVQSSLLASVMPESAFERIPFPPMAPDTNAERDRDVIAERNRLGKLMELEAHIAKKGGSEAEQAAVYRDNMRRGGRVSIF